MIRFRPMTDIVSTINRPKPIYIRRARVADDLAHLPAVAVALVAVRVDQSIVHQLSEVLSRSLAEGLTLLRRVDAGEADLVLALVAIQHRDRVAVADAYDPPGNDPGVAGEGDARRQERRGEEDSDKSHGRKSYANGWPTS